MNYSESIEAPAPPHNIELEQALLGALLVNPDCYDEFSSLLEPQHFFDGLHSQLYQACVRLIIEGKRPTPALLKPEFEGGGSLGEITVAQYLGRLVRNATSVLNAKSYATSIRDLSVRRDLIAVCRETMQTAGSLQDGQTALQVLEAAERDLSEVASGTLRDDGPVLLRDAVTKSIDMLAKVYAADRGITGIATGLTDIDARLGGLCDSDLIVVAGRPAMGKAQPLHSKVLTPNGFVTMGSLKIGDEVCHPSGAKSHIIQIHPQGTRKVWEVNFADGRSTLATSDHLWEVRARKGSNSQTQILSTSELRRRLRKARHRGRISVPLASPIFGGGAKFGIRPYLLGLLLGDGCFSNKVHFTSPDLELVDALEKHLPPNVKIGTKRFRNGAWHISIIGEERPKNAALDIIRALGLFGKRSFERFIPEEYMTGSREDRTALLQGLLDTDGTVEPSGTIRYTTTSIVLSNQVEKLVRSVGGTAKTRSRITQFCGTDGIKKDGRRSYTTTVRYPEPRTLFRLQRQINRLPETYQYSDLRLQIDSVRYFGKEACQCITVTAPDGLYITDDFIVTHNSAFAGQIAYNIAHQFAETRHLEAPEGGPVGLFSMEMSDEQYATRLISGAAGIPSNRLRMGRFSQDQFNTVVDVADRVVSEAPVYIDQTPGLEIDRLVGRARRMKRKFGVILIVVDYLQLIRASRRYAGNRVQEIAEITGKLKELAKDLQIPVVALSQLSRKVEERDDKRPKLADLRESGSIEQDADAVILLFREAHYLEQKQPAEGSSGYATWQDEMRKVEGVAEAIIAKNRHGSTGVVQVHFDAPLTKFTNLQKQEDLLEMRDDFDKAS